MNKLSFLGAFSRVTPSGILLETNGKKIVLDYGADVEFMPPAPPLPVDKANYALLSHAHLDHCGSLPILAKNSPCPIYSNPCSKNITKLLLMDSVKVAMAEIGTIEEAKLPFTKLDVKLTMRKFIDVPYRKPFQLGNVKVTNFDAGHIPGSIMSHLEFNGKSLLYTGNFNTIDTRLLEGCDKDLPDVDILITESTYSQRDHPDRKQVEKDLVNLVNETISNDGVALISTFAVGRAQEILLILDHYGIDYPLYLDGMAKKATTIVNQHRNLLNDPKSLDKALKKVNYVFGDRMRDKIVKQPCAIVTTSGMLNGGTVIPYIKSLHKDKNSSLMMTGFQVEGTPGHKLLQTGRFVTDELDLEMNMFVKRFDFSAHVGRKELFGFVKDVDPEKVFCVHGDNTEKFAQELKEKGFEAIAPTADNKNFEI